MHTCPSFHPAGGAARRAGLRAQPAGIVEGTPPLLTIVAKNKKAGALGLQIGMTKSQAEQIPGLQLRRARPRRKRRLMRRWWIWRWRSARASRIRPRIRSCSISQGSFQLFGSLRKSGAAVGRAREEIWIVRANVAVGSNPEAAQLAARGFSGVTVLSPEEEAQRLGSLPISR